MSGVTDLPFRRLARRLGAALVVSEMVACDQTLLGSEESRLRSEGEGLDIHVVQLAGRDPHAFREGVRVAEGAGADIIDINMGCPAKKICNVAAGSALLRDEPLVAQIVDAVVRAVDVPVTLKIRTGWSKETRNALRIAKIAEDHGIQSLAMHGRTRACMYTGDAEYDTIRAVKQSVRLPVIANGDITTPEKAKFVLEYTGADAVMIGRAAQGRPWIFREIGHFLATGEHLAPPLVVEVRRLLLDHLEDHYRLYGELTGVRSARKHIAWYLRALPGGEALRAHINTIEDCASQWRAVADYLDALAQQMDRLPVAAGMDADTEEQEGLAA